MTSSKRDQKRPYATTVSGEVRGAGTACGGAVTLRVFGKVRAEGMRGRVAVAGERTVAVRSVGGRCTYDARVRIAPTRKALAGRELSGTVTVRVAFGGTETLTGSQTSVQVRLG